MISTNDDIYGTLADMCHQYALLCSKKLNVEDDVSVFSDNRYEKLLWIAKMCSKLGISSTWEVGAVISHDAYVCAEKWMYDHRKDWQTVFGVRLRMAPNTKMVVGEDGKKKQVTIPWSELTVEEKEERNLQQGKGLMVQVLNQWGFTQISSKGRHRKQTLGLD